MTLNRQLITLAGVLVAAVVLALGLALIAAPMFSQAQALDANTRQVTQTNATYQAQIDALSLAEKNIADTDAAVATLRTQIAAIPALDDIYEIVGAVAQSQDVRIESITAEDPAPFVPRDTLDADGTAVAAPTPTPAASPSEDGVDAAATAPAPPSSAADAPQQQVSVKIVVDLSQPYALPAADAAPPALDDAADPAAVRAAATERAMKAAAFVDALGKGPRLVAPVDVAYADSTLTVQLLTFIRTEDPR
ncbi:hypothetical protein [Microbacterium flavum]|uniref:Tfp pilus assembly protein PilO n=1 Tax=Microbacterium flavum TaxID=415216 RepID=A0ABS5XSU6_9MICO|nr:hypothetical protein [Microbacterium flavum]MBT8797017.1 hypothetical protein [Microbacterium flavum]